MADVQRANLRAAAEVNWQVMFMLLSKRFFHHENLGKPINSPGLAAGGKEVRRRGAKVGIVGWNDSPLGVRSKINIIVPGNSRDSRLGHRFDGRGPKALVPVSCQRAEGTTCPAPRPTWLPHRPPEIPAPPACRWLPWPWYWLHCARASRSIAISTLSRRAHGSRWFSPRSPWHAWGCAVPCYQVWPCSRRFWPSAVAGITTDGTSWQPTT